MDRAEFPVPQGQSSIVLYIGCVGRSTEVETAGNSIKLLQRLNVDFTLIDEVCCEAVKAISALIPILIGFEITSQRLKRPAGKEVLFLCPTC